METVRRIGWGVWEIRVPIEDANDERNRSLRRVFRGKAEDAHAEAERLMRELLEAKDTEPFSTYSTYTLEQFIAWPAWGLIKELLRGNGGCYGVAGARGAGKSWLLRRAAQAASDQGGLGIYFPAPSAYDPASFLVSITDAVATTLQRTIRPTGARKSVFTLARKPAVLVLGLATIIATILWFGQSALIQPDWATVWLVVAMMGLSGLYAVVLWTIRSRLRSGSPELLLTQLASDIRQRLRFALTTRDTNEFAMEAGKGLLGKFRQSLEESWSERPLTNASLVYEFRDLVETTASILRRPVVVGLDELDKISDLEQMRKLLRDVKGILDVPGVTFLVSISDEALRCVDLGALTGRDEFSSSLYTVVEIPPLSLGQTRELVKARIGPFAESLEGPVSDSRTALVLGVMTGGVPREVIRLIGLVGEEQVLADDYATVTLTALRDEAENLIDFILRDQSLDEQGRVAASRNLWTQWMGASDIMELDYSQTSAGWQPSWAPSSWENSPVAEPWRRLLLRGWIGASLCNPNRELTQLDRLAGEAQRIVISASKSAAFARELFEQTFPEPVAPYAPPT